MAEETQIRDEMPKAYEPHKIESKWYKYWLDNDYFQARIDHDKEPFVIMMPLPNLTGELHIGHVLFVNLQDIMTRWHRMKGEPTLWLPGVDHASIAAQMVVEQLLAKEGTNRHQLGREKFLERMWQWMNTYRHIISEQHQKLGASCDWSRESFTMDEGPQRAVRTTFVNLYRDGLIYRGERMLPFARRVADRFCILERGRSVAAGKMEKLGDDLVREYLTV